MNRYALIIVASLVTFLARAQNYPPLLDNSLWSVRVTTITGNVADHWLQYELDTTINSTVYRKYVRSWAGTDPDLVREDVANKKVYKYLPWTGEEFLMFDFSLQLGDNIVLGNNANYVVDAVDSINVTDGGKRRRLLLVRYVGTFLVSSETWIEGVGHPSMPLTPFFLMTSDPDYQLTCSYQNGNPVYNQGIANNTVATDCPELPTAVTEADIRIGAFVSPNPGSGIFHLLISTTLQGASTLLVHDVHGHLVMEKTLSSNVQAGQGVMLDLSGHAPGIYHASVVAANERLHTRIMLQGR